MLSKSNESQKAIRKEKPPESDRIYLGETEDKQMFYITWEMIRRHFQMLGITGCGKTFLALAMIYQGILLGKNLVVIDPLGTLFRQAKSFVRYLYSQLTVMTRTRYPKYNQQILAERDYLVGRMLFQSFVNNDLCGFKLGALATSARFDAEAVTDIVIKAFARATDGNLAEQLRRVQVMRAALSLTAFAGGALTDAPLLLMKSGEEIVKFIDGLVINAKRAGRPLNLEYVRMYMNEYFVALQDRQRNDLVASTYTAFGPLLGKSKLFNWLNSPIGNLHFERVCDVRGVCFFCEIPRNLGLQEQRVAGALVLEWVKQVCMSRKNPQENPVVYLIVDEAHLIMDVEMGIDSATVRNYNLSMTYMGQSTAQFLDESGNDMLLQNLTQNTWTKIYFTLGSYDGEKLAKEIFQPRGEMEKAPQNTITNSHQESYAQSITESVSRAIGEANAHSDGTTISFGEGQVYAVAVNNGHGYVHSEGHAISVGETDSEVFAKSETLGTTLVQTKTKGESSGTADAHGTAVSNGTMESSGQGNSTNFGEASSQNLFYSFNDGRSVKTGMIDAGMGGVQMSTGNGESSAKNSGTSDSTMHSTATSFQKAASDVLSATKSRMSSRGEAVGVNKGTSKTTAKGKAWSKTTGKSLADAFSIIESLMRSISHSVSVSEARSQSDTETHSETNTKSFGTSTTRGHSDSVSVATSTPYMNLSEEAVVRGYKLSSLPARHAYVLTKHDNQVRKIKTLDLPTSWELPFKSEKLERQFEEAIRPEPVVVPEKNLFERIEDEKHRQFQKLEKPKGFQ